MRRLAVVVTMFTVFGLALWVLGPRLGQTFPAMEDDWNSISRAPGQIKAALTFGMPEDLRYRPAWIVWTYLQWHSLGAPNDLGPPLAWNLLRLLILVAGLAAAAFAVSARTGARQLGWGTRSLLAGGAAAVVVTIPGLAVDLARYGPQEPQMIGFMCGGAALFALAVRRALDGAATATSTAILGTAAALLWWAGVGQKESSICVLALLPFTWLAVRRQLGAFRALVPSVRRALWVTGSLALAAFVPVLLRTVQLSRAEERVYGAEPRHDLLARTWRQITTMDDALGVWTGSVWTGAVLFEVAVGLCIVVAVSRRVDWFSVGLLTTAAAFLVFAATTDVVASRYYLPSLALASLTIVRLAPDLPRAAAVAIASALVLGSLWQAPAARDKVDSLIGWHRAQEELVRAAGRFEAAGCPVAVTGPDVEFVAAVPVLLSLVQEDPAACEPGTKLVAVMTGTNPSNEDPDDPLVVACGANATVEFTNDIGRLLRCETAASGPG